MVPGDEYVFVGLQKSEVALVYGSTQGLNRYRFGSGAVIRTDRENTLKLRKTDRLFEGQRSVHVDVFFDVAHGEFRPGVGKLPAGFLHVEKRVLDFEPSEFIVEVDMRKLSLRHPRPFYRMP